jgi:putative PEP-CTERM system TPR-repeat lipoprotein
MIEAIAAQRVCRWAQRFAVAAVAAFLALAPVPGFADADSSRQYYEDALEWLKKGDFRAAVIQLRNALQQDADNYPARLLLGRLYLQSGNLAAAEKELDYVHRGQPTDETEVFLGRTQLGLRQYDKVLVTVRETADDPNFAAAKTILRAEALFALNVLDEAEQKIAEVLKADPASIPANLLMARIKAQQGNREASDKFIDAALLAKPDLVEAYILRAQLALQARELDRVLEIADKVIAVAPTDPRGKLMKAEALVRKNQLAEARDLLSAFLVESPNVTSAIYLQARILMLMNDYAGADAELTKLPDNVRRQPAASLIVGLVKYQLGQYAQAEEALDRFLAVSDGNRQARRLLANIQLRSNRPLAALRTLEPLTTENSSDIAAFQLSASAALRAGDLDMARLHLQRVAQIGTQTDQRQAATFLQVLGAGTKNAAGKLELDGVARGLLEALDLAQFGESEAALTKALELQARDPESSLVANLLARLYVAKGELQQARAVLEPILQRNPTDLPSIANMNRIDTGEGKFDAVEARLRAAMAVPPPNEALILQLAQFLANRGREDEALALLEETASTLPDSLAIRTNLISVSLRQKRPEAARRWADEAARIGEAGNPSGLSVAAEAYAALKDYAAAVRTFEKLADRQNGAAETLLKLAQAQLLNGDAAASQATLEKILATDPGNFAASRALIAMLLGNKDEAGAMAVAGRAEAANRPMGAILRAAIYRATDQIDRAVLTLQNQLAETPSAALVQQTYSMLIEAKRRDEAADVVSGWLGENPDDASMLQLLSAHYIQDGKLSEAAGLLERAYSMLPSNVIVLNNLAWVRYELKRPGAAEMARRAYTMAPNAPAIADTLGWILVRDGQFEEGLKLLYAAADGAPENGDIAYHVAFALSQTGKKQEAVAVLERILAADVAEQNFTERAKAEALLDTLRKG